MKKMFVLMFGVFLLVGCAKKEGPYGGHSGEWYKNHPTQSCKQKKWCSNHLTDRSDLTAENCESASVACLNSSD
ncbi:EexN family lipoprotein [Acidithiobacillus sp.]|jgi:hypothetical protein|uniref:EexN family lipoprotein n=1 Tax=Acidithiobacillus sp. TaxID=1872118 RepID=UPI00345BAEE7